MPAIPYWHVWVSLVRPCWKKQTNCFCGCVRLEASAACIRCDCWGELQSRKGKTGVGAGVADVLKQVNVFDQIQFGAAVAPWRFAKANAAILSLLINRSEVFLPGVASSAGQLTDLLTLWSSPPWCAPFFDAFIFFDSPFSRCVLLRVNCCPGTLICLNIKTVSEHWNGKAPLRVSHKIGGCIHLQ